MQDLCAALKDSKLIQTYFSDIEAPAIEFDNSIMHKYRGEPCRSADYNSCVTFRTRDQYVQEWIEEELYRRETRALRQLERASASEELGR